MLLSLPRTWVQSLVRELRSGIWKPHGAAKKKKNSFKAVRAKKWYDTQRIITRYWPNS